jgi:hypothetical protein
VSPLPPIAHIVAIVAGVWGGLTVMGAIAPDLPGADVQPGVTAEAAPQSGDDPDSLLAEDNLDPALTQLADQLGTTSDLVRLRITPSQLDATEGEGGFDVDAVDPTAPQRLVEMISEERPKVRGLEDVQYMELVEAKQGAEWYVQLVSTRDDLPPPWTYGAPQDLSKLTVGGAPPQPIAP